MRDAKVHKIARPLRLPQAEIEALVEELLRQSLRKLGEPEAKPVGEQRQLARETFLFRNVRGEPDGVTVIMWARHLGPKHDYQNIVQGAFGRHKRTGEKFIVLEIHSEVSRSVLAMPESLLREELMKVLLHEMTHAYSTPAEGQDDEGTVTRTEDGEVLWDEYYNHPEELRAFMQEIVYKAYPIYSRLRDRLGPQRALKMALGHTSWGDMEEYLSPKNRKYMLKGIWQGLEERMTEGGGVRKEAKKKPLPKTVERYFEEHSKQGLDDGYAWALAWSRYCKKYPGSPRCHQKEYFHGKGEGGGEKKKAEKISKRVARHYVKKFL